MKKILFAFSVIIFTSGAYAQSDSTNKKLNPPSTNNTNNGIKNPIDSSDLSTQTYQDSSKKSKSTNVYPDGVMMKDGVMWMVKNSKMTILDHTMIMSNGTTVMSNGTYMRKNGIEMMFREGEHMDMIGNFIPMKK